MTRPNTPLARVDRFCGRTLPVVMALALAVIAWRVAVITRLPLAEAGTAPTAPFERASNTATAPAVVDCVGQEVRR